ncbi:MAG: hypothetical protein L6R41_001729 [Letrouitia leprolyta]|nr:MAG: hypothetical protein L6R41_001729 [Letrouitia leprolyta]
MQAKISGPDVRGPECKFSHESAAENAANEKPQKFRTDQRQLSDIGKRFRDWTFLIPRQKASPQIPELGRFFTLGWDLLSVDPTEIGQQVIKKLATEEGLAMIRALTDGQEDNSPPKSLDVFKDKTLPFLRTLTHPDIESSLILETPLETIFNFLFGPNGRRAVSIFKSTASAIGSPTLHVGNHDDEFVTIAVTTCLSALERIVELNQGAQVIDQFTAIVNDLAAKIPEHRPEAGNRKLIRLQQRLGIGATIPLLEHRPEKLTSGRPVFSVKQDLPGALSEFGPRHDNDHSSIVDIKILPTDQEIQSSRVEYLPSNDPTTHHLPGLAGLLDRQFRLLREDTVGQLRDAVQEEYQRLNGSTDAQTPSRRQRNGARNIVYHNVVLLRLEFGRKKGLQVVIEFDQPSPLTQKGAKEREEWWTNSKRLLMDSFVCLMSSTGRIIFFSVSDPAPTPPLKGRDEEGKDRLADYKRALSEQPSLFKDPKRAAMMLSLVEENAEDVTWINRHLGKVRQLRQSLVEFPGILLASFQPTLQAIQSISRNLDLPFSQFIAPEVKHGANVKIPAPAYSRRPGFVFNLESLTGGEQISMRPGLPFDDNRLRNECTLDDAQRIATLDALSQCLALIQGPPGTGKSYTGVAIIKVLLENRIAAELGPIICVCYTNHALDQLLEHLIKDGVKQVIRIGSRSKSQLLSELNLHHVSKEALATKTERYEKYKLYEELDVILDEIGELMPALQDPGHWRNVKRYLEIHHPRYFQELFGFEIDEYGFREVKGKRFSALQSWIKGAPKRITSNRKVSELYGTNLKEMSSAERSSLHRHWIEQSMAESNRRLLHTLDSYQHVKSSLKKCRQEVDLRCLIGAHIIGVTTTGLARNLDLLRRVRSKAVVIEEAGEVLEAHTLTALLPSVEHAILIGDHEQLRPQINNFDFQSDNPKGARFSLDISLFERLVNPQPGYPELPYSSLEVQRRMHPSIARLIRSTLYPKLQDDVSVSKYPEVDGMRRRLFWLDHNNREDASLSKLEQSYSKTNSWEVEMVAALVTHLVRQGVYNNEHIAVLTPYLGQLQKLKQRLRSSFDIVVGDRDMQEIEAKGIEGDDAERPTTVTGGVRKSSLLNAVRIATVDNFQGEEAKVIIISLVRSNDERRCGFLKTSNRINVLLSRAQHGMYIIGNSDTARIVPMWDRVITILGNDGNLGPTLALCCPRHKERQIECPSVCGERCPDAQYCQKCAEKSVKDLMVDYIMGSSYADVDLDESPCIIPSCGHVLTMESMDGHMEMSKYYVLSSDPDAEDPIIALKSSSTPFTSEPKNCPMCRRPLRDINRYGRIVRRAWIDEATKKFIVCANAQFAPLATQMGEAELRLRESTSKMLTTHTRSPQSPQSPQSTELSSAFERLSLEPFLLSSSRDEQIRTICKVQDNNDRYRDIFLLRNKIGRFLHDVDEAEQPIGRIYAMIEDARSHRGVTTQLTDIPSVLQVRNRLLATVLSLRCDYAILCDFITHRGKTASGENLRNFHVDFALNRKDCEKLIAESHAQYQSAQLVEGLLYFTRFVALERGRSAKLNDEKMSALVDRARYQLGLARRTCNTHRGQTAGMLEEVVEAEKMLRDSTFYAPVTNEEKAAVYAAMAQSFRGTGHWYHCVNGHPFTVGECGMPMQTARCPQCGAVVGGNNHMPAAGVTSATDFEAEFGRRG